jgi:hypothetical protein
MHLLDISSLEGVYTNFNCQFYKKGVSAGGEGHEVGTHVTRSTKTFA